MLWSLLHCLIKDQYEWSYYRPFMTVQFLLPLGSNRGCSLDTVSPISSPKIQFRLRVEFHHVSVFEDSLIFDQPYVSIPAAYLKWLISSPQSYCWPQQWVYAFAPKCIYFASRIPWLRLYLDRGLDPIAFGSTYSVSPLGIDTRSQYALFLSKCSNL